MDDLIKALQIFRKYTDALYPTSCEHDCLYVHVDPEKVSSADKMELERLGFDSSSDPEEYKWFESSRFGSC